MRLVNKIVILFAVIAACSASMDAQYYQMANQLQQMIRPALTGGLNYKGFVDASYLQGFGDRNASFAEISTTQGFKYADWFFMGVGAGVEVVMTNPQTQFSDWGGVTDDFDRHKGHSKTGWIIPLYTDFRFNIGKPSDIGFYIDLRLGASFLLSDRYLEIGDGYLTNSECFYFRPSIGMRIPMSMTNTRQALNIGISYQLMTSNYWYYHSSDITLKSIGVTIGFEW